MINFINIRVERIREARARTRRTEIKNLTFKDSEEVESFNIRLMKIVNDLKVLWNLVIEHKKVLKYLQSVAQPYKQMAMAIETLLDLKTLSTEEVTVWLLMRE